MPPRTVPIPAVTVTVTATPTVTVRLTLAVLLTAIPLAACAPLGMGPRHPLSLPTLRPDPDDIPLGEALKEPVPPLNTVRLPGWPYRFTGVQFETLRSLHCDFGKQERDRAVRLAKRGFSAADYVQAHLDFQRYGAGRHRRHIETLAAYRRLGFDVADYAAFRRTGRSLTDQFNRRFIGGQSLTLNGWIFMGVGSGLIIAGGAAIGGYAAWHDRCLAQMDDWDPYGCDEGETSRMLTYLIALPVMVAGALMTLIGASTTIAGAEKRGRWLKNGLLDRAHVDDLDAIRLRYLMRSVKKPKLKFSFAPTVSRRGGGLAFQLRF